uniref:Uncharacterized protein n=1 Tax=Glossina palpalis gambiensis TaxID=67801 RepID=A0A1B0BNI7_9MUSC
MTSDAEAFNHLPHYRRRRRSIEDTLPTETEIHQPIKKDLSKTAYYSKLKREQYKQNEHVNSVYAGLADDLRKEFKKEHKITFEAFGENINLTLRPTQGLFKDARGAHKLPMWYVHPEANATNGLNIQKIEDEKICGINLWKVPREPVRKAAYKHSDVWREDIKRRLRLGSISCYLLSATTNQIASYGSSQSEI